MTDRIVLRAFVQGSTGPEKCGGTSIYLDLPDGMPNHEVVDYISRKAKEELERYLGHECLVALGRAKHGA